MSHPTLSVDLGGTRIKLGVIRGGVVLAQSVIDAHSRDGIAPRLPAIVQAMDQLCAEAGINRTDCGGIGMAFPSLIDPKKNSVASVVDKYPDAKGFDFVGWAKRELNLPIAIDNDAHAALAGEWQFGVGRSVASCVIMTLGTGIGTSAIIDGVPLRGEHGQAGNLGGHFVVNAFGRKCICGGIGCLETECAQWVLPTIAREHPQFSSSGLSKIEAINFAALFSLAEQGDSLAIELRDRCIRYWAVGAVNMVHAFDPELVILGGGVMKSAAVIVPPIQKYIDDHAWLGWGKVRVASGTLGDGAALLGLSYLAQEAARRAG